MAGKKRSGFGEERDREGPSRSAKKRESAALQKIGESLIKLSAEARKDLPLSEEMREALAFYDTLSNKEACRRQRQFIGKVMREENVAEIMSALGKLEDIHAAQAARFHAAQSWREKLLLSPEAGAEEFIRSYKLSADNAEKADLISLASRARQAGASDPALKRALFRLILTLLEKAEF